MLMLGEMSCELGPGGEIHIVCVTFFDNADVRPEI
jgi:hypothetical protein